MDIVEKVAPGWVYNFADYCQMFDLSEADRKKAILDFPGGVSSFNAEMHELGHSVLSADVAYVLSPDEIQQHAQKVYEKNEDFLTANMQTLRSHVADEVDKIFAQWQDNMRMFIDHYAQSSSSERYCVIDSSTLPFSDGQFSLALCSDFMFHTQSSDLLSPEVLIKELCRVAHEVRVFPLLDEKGEVNPGLGPLMLMLQQDGYGVEVREVPYELRKGGNAMLRVWSNQCEVVKT